MSSDLTGDDYLREYPHVSKDVMDLQLVQLALAVAAVGFVLAAYVDRNVTATFIASSTPREERWKFSKHNFRGLPIIVVHRLLKISLLSLFPARGSSVIKCFLLSVISDLTLSTLKVANVHTVLNLHSQVPLHRRIFNQSIWFDIFPATLLYSTAWNSCFYLTIYAIRTLGFLDHEFTMVSREIALYIAFITFGTTYFGAMVPAHAIFIRVAVSVNPLQDNRRQRTRNLDIKGNWESLPCQSINAFNHVLMSDGSFGSAGAPGALETAF
ncbi:hypothetical protein PENVUL_c015G10024 [Penicillium vulpinum]|uniref:Uncharacterized protein n=1 Tax=Penicillium vulpinum TaxID=29845 RepID=A0A1V6RZ64_9EURO|nr:hypothetical protein PENVUL_c015G10024 [Penicillium vulpinum]